MRHLTITEAGRSLGTEDELLVIKEKGEVLKEIPLKRLRTIQIAGRGVVLSSNLMLELSKRGISLFVIDFRQRPMAMLTGVQQHAVVQMRIKQMEYLTQKKLHPLCAAVISGKIRNQRAVLLYFAKGLKKNEPKTDQLLHEAAHELLKLANMVKTIPTSNNTDSMESLLGYEGRAAAIYWQAIKETRLLSEKFTGRTGRGAIDIPNAALNLGYSILMSYVWHAVVLAGLEPYLGFLHTDRPGKPALVLDLMEEYRPWIVDRNVMKLRGEIDKAKDLNATLRKKLIASIHEAFDKKIHHGGKRIRLSALLQRQVYRLCGVFYEEKKYKPILFKW